MIKKTQGGHSDPSTLPHLRGQRFTLVELLVVIAIISILAGMLLPALRTALDVSRSTTCLNNLKQISMIMTLYVQDQNIPNPPPSWGSERWTDIPARELELTQGSYQLYTSTAQNSSQWQSPAFFGPLRCASDTTRYDSGGSNFYHPNYGINGSNSGAWGGAYERKVEAIRSPSEVMYLGDGFPNSTYYNVSVARYGTATLSDTTKIEEICRHRDNSAAAFAFFDLHVEMKSYGELVEEYTKDLTWKSKFFDSLRHF